MKQTLDIECSCGAVKGTVQQVAPATTNHVLCSCRACQAYAHFLGRADEMLEGGTASRILQCRPAHHQITEGHAHIACIQLTPKGPLRWYADCCKTPMGNTWPGEDALFIGLLALGLKPVRQGQHVDDFGGPVRAHVNQAGPVPRAEKWQGIFMTIRFLWLLLRWRLADGRKKLFWDRTPGIPQPERVLMEKAEYKKWRSRTQP